MKLLRLPLTGVCAGVRVLSPDEARYVSRVHRLVEGDVLVVFDPDARVEAAARVHSVEKNAVSLLLDAPVVAPVVATRAVRWVHALPKGAKAESIVQDATELGATAVSFVDSSRAVVKLDDARAKARVARWEKIAREAARQCGRGDAPVIDPVRSWHLALAAVTEVSRFCLYERAVVPLGPLLRASLDRADSLAFAVGPEGGLSHDEVTVAEAAGFVVVSVGTLILRTETVCAAVLGAVTIGGLPPAPPPPRSPTSGFPLRPGSLRGPLSVAFPHCAGP